ncbi:hypothetical protein GH833_29115 [Bacillus thuringiensis]|uniref:Uncharacterized protein n=1 Tax=Bacillus thuringiensis TaxID=1428 RepID=A0AAP4Q931_BACTU|nr:hypothetical protein [Bacillus thuringiensis]HEE9035097.1 hypothetical protein [Bacillus cereus]MDN7079976.1 hypothetical protein [Bacillus thuringiensis]MDQ7258096.1 hypothetical protein [Bacillus thuringiensis]MDR5031634.1 hypothetical protein [Bacillus thuringiensis]
MLINLEEGYSLWCTI